MKTYSKVENPRWANESKTLINVEVQFDDPDIGYVSFSAAQTDHPNAGHGPQIWKECIGGKYGPIAEYKKP